jgi:hypothetical protein
MSVFTSLSEPAVRYIVEVLLYMHRRRAGSYAGKKGDGRNWEFHEIAFCLRSLGAYQSMLTDDQRPMAGQIDKASQGAAWRIGDNTETIFESSLANLTQDVSPVAIHFGKTRTQTWLLVSMPEPAPAGEPQKLPEAPKVPPPLKTAKAK